jgi:hypothetical protein
MAAIAVIAVGILSMCAWVPTIGYDDLAYHLALPSQLQAYGFYRMDAATNVWAVSAWLGDVLHAVIEVMSGKEARGVVVIYWLAIAGVFIWMLCRAIGISQGLSWLAVALYASLPVTASTLAGMQTEGATAALIVAAAWIVQVHGTDRRRGIVVLVMGCLFGYLVGLKVINVLFVAPLGVWLLCRLRGRLAWHGTACAVGAAVLIGASSYVYAYALTGNPVLPVFNGIFRSEYFDPTNFHDSRWETGVPWNILMRLVFHTSAYMETGDGTGGFPLIALVGCFVMALLRRESRVLALLGGLMFLLPFSQLQYLRYAHPAMVLLIPAALRGLPEGGEIPGRNSLAVMLPLIILVVMDLLFISSADWMRRSGVVRLAAKGAHDALFEQFAPTRHLADIVAHKYGDVARILVVSKAYPFAAEFAGRAYVTTWYDLRTMRKAEAAEQDLSGDAWQALWDELGVNLLILEDSDLKPAIRQAIRGRGGVLETAYGGVQLWHISDKITAGSQLHASPDTWGLHFDTTASKVGPHLASIRVELECGSSMTPMLVSWIVDTGKGAWNKDRRVTCAPSGEAYAALDVAVPNGLNGVDFKVAAASVAGVKLLSSQADIRFDNRAANDLSQRLFPRRRKVEQLQSYP